MNLRQTARFLSDTNLAASIRSQEVTVRSLTGVARHAAEQERLALGVLQILEAERDRRATWKRVRGMRHKGKA